MTATAYSDSGWSHIGPSTQLPSGNALPLRANAQAGRGQAVYFDVNGDVALNDGTVAGELSAGFADPTYLSPVSATAGAAETMVHQGFGSGRPASTIANDGFTKADQLVVVYDAGNGVPGKLSTYAGNKRSIMGLAFGVDALGHPIVWASPVAAGIARSLLATSSALFASYQLADAAASTATAERTIPHAQLGGTIGSVVYNGAAVAADNTDYVTVTISKRDGAGGAAVVLGTYDSRAANQGAASAFEDKAFALSVVAGALNLLPTDIVTVTVAKTGAGQQLIGTILVNGKVV